MNNETADVVSAGESPSAVAITRDFAALAALFEEHLQLVPHSDLETRSHLEKAVEAAQRGVELGRRLSELQQQRR